MTDASKTRTGGYVAEEVNFITSRSIGVYGKTCGYLGSISCPGTRSGDNLDLISQQDLAPALNEDASQRTMQKKADLPLGDCQPHLPVDEPKPEPHRAAAKGLPSVPTPPPVPAHRTKRGGGTRPSDRRPIPKPAQPKIKPRDSRRKRGQYTRETTRVNDATVKELEAAARHAELNGTPLRVAVTINLMALKEAGSCRSLATKPANDALRDLRSNCRRFFRNHNVDYTAIWVRKVDVIAGEHVHLAVHVPDKLMQLFLAFVATYTGVQQGHPEPGMWEAHYIATSSERSWLVARIFDTAEWIDYLLKGQDGSQGTVYGKRAGCSRNIGASAQRGYRGRRCPSFARQGD